MQMLQIVTVEFAVDLEPWQWFALGKVDHPLHVTCNLCIPGKNTLG
jgi:hypothetical protein